MIQIFMKLFICWCKLPKGRLVLGSSSILSWYSLLLTKRNQMKFWITIMHAHGWQLLIMTFWTNLIHAFTYLAYFPILSVFQLGYIENNLSPDDRNTEGPKIVPLSDQFVLINHDSKMICRDISACPRTAPICQRFQTLTHTLIFLPGLRPGADGSSPPERFYISLPGFLSYHKISYGFKVKVILWKILNEYEALCSPKGVGNPMQKNYKRNFYIRVGAYLNFASSSWLH